MRLLTWNIQAGGAARADRIVAEVRRHEPDVLVLTEVRSSSSALLAELARSGWPHQAVGANRDGRGAAAVLSREPVERVGPAPLEEEFPGRWVEVRVPSADLTVVGIYGPLREEDHGAFWRAVRRALEDRGETPVIVAGDLNTGESLVDAPDARFFCSEHFAAVKALGFVDAWRAMHGDSREYSWFSRGEGGALLNGFRLDHALLSPAAAPRLRSAAYVHDARTAGHSDHAPLVVDLASDTPA